MQDISISIKARVDAHMIRSLDYSKHAMHHNWH